MSRFEPWSEERTVEIVNEHQALEGPLMPILHAVQETFGFVPEEAISATRCLCELPTTQVTPGRGAISPGARWA